MLPLEPAVIDRPFLVMYFVFVTSFLWLRLTYFVTTSVLPAPSLSVCTTLYRPDARTCAVRVAPGPQVAVRAGAERDAVVSTTRDPVGL